MFCSVCGTETETRFGAICKICESTSFTFGNKKTTKDYDDIDYNDIGFIGIRTQSTCIMCNRIFYYQYIGGPKRNTCPECGGVEDDNVTYNRV